MEKQRFYQVPARAATIFVKRNCNLFDQEVSFSDLERCSEATASFISTNTHPCHCSTNIMSNWEMMNHKFALLRLNTSWSSQKR